MPKLHDKIYKAIIWRQNAQAMRMIEETPVTIERGLYKGAIQLLHHAVKVRNYRFAKQLLEKGVDIDCLDGFEKTALEDAAQRGHLAGMKWLIRQGADFEGQRYNLLLAAVRCGHPKLIKWLIAEGCDVNAADGEDGENALSHCYGYCETKHREKIADLLRSYGAEFPPGFDPDAETT